VLVDSLCKTKMLVSVYMGTSTFFGSIAERSCQLNATEDCHPIRLWMWSQAKFQERITVIEISRKGQLVNPKYVVLLIDLTWSTRLGSQLQKGPESNEGWPLKILDARLLNSLSCIAPWCAACYYFTLSNARWFYSSRGALVLNGLICSCV
jgi:hypothetical protein